MAAVFVEEMVRLKREGYRPNRDIILALTADEELGDNSEVNGVEFLLRAHKDLVDADLALNEGGGGRVSNSGKYERLNVQVSEKIYQDYRLQIVNPGGHSSVPKPGALPPSEITPRSLGAHLRRLQQRHVLFNLLIGGIVRARRWARRDD
jgi:acetylornithine deacetylase/succinyl-diaminopimelate desuccinylase-like protein